MKAAANKAASLEPRDWPSVRVEARWRGVGEPQRSPKPRISRFKTQILCAPLCPLWFNPRVMTTTDTGTGRKPPPWSKKDFLTTEGPEGHRGVPVGECRHQPPTDSDRPTDCPEPAPQQTRLPPVYLWAFLNLWEMCFCPTRSNPADAPNAAMAFLFHLDRHRRGVGNLRRSAGEFFDHGSHGSHGSLAVAPWDTWLSDPRDLESRDQM